MYDFEISYITANKRIIIIIFGSMYVSNYPSDLGLDAVLPVYFDLQHY